MSHALHIKRIYDPLSADDGMRVLVDRLWPRGVSKDHAALDLWAKDLTPSDALRRAYHDAGQDFDAFALAYEEELAANPRAAKPILQALREGPVTLLTANRDMAQNHAHVLKAWLEKQQG